MLIAILQGKVWIILFIKFKSYDIRPGGMF